METKKIREYYTREEVADLISNHQAEIEKIIKILVIEKWRSFWNGYAVCCVQSLVLIFIGVMIYWSLK